MNWIIKFLDHNGMRPVIALVVIVGAQAITLESHKICIVKVEYTQASSTSPGSPPQVILRDNPVCSKYFEIAALVLGGLLGLSEPNKSGTAGKSRSSEAEEKALKEQQTTREISHSDRDD